MLKSDIRAYWGRLVLAGCSAWLFGYVLTLLFAISGWLYSQSAWEIIQRIAFDMLFALAAGIISGTGTLIILSPLLLSRKRDTYMSAAVEFASVAAGGACVARLLLYVHDWANSVHLTNPTWISKLSPVPSSVLCLAFGIVLAFILRLLRRAKSSEDFLAQMAAGPMTRRGVVTAGIGAALVAAAATGRAAIETASARKGASSSRPTNRPSVLLVTFDALSARDVSHYGYRLPTTPNLDAFAHSASVFTNYYTSATFTTPSVGTFMTGRYPSSLKLYHLEGAIRGESAAKNLAHEMRAAGYVTAASVANPLAHPNRLGIGGDFDHIGAVPAMYDAIPNTVLQLPRNNSFYDVDVFTGKVERLVTGGKNMFSSTAKYPPELSFAQAESLLRKMAGQPFFLWVHVLAPHAPWQPRSPFVNRFTADLRTRELLGAIPAPTHHYSPEMQPAVDAFRLRYNEWILQADAAFGGFIERMNAAGLMRDTIIATSADHGESFENGLFGHVDPAQGLPIIHIPLMVHQPGQTEGRRITAVADHTALAPTILDLVGLPRPEWMDGQSLRPYMEAADGGAGQGLAFCQHLDRNKISGTLINGTMGVIDGQHRYLLDIATGKGVLSGLDGSDSSSTDLVLSKTLRQHIISRFPELPPGLA